MDYYAELELKLNFYNFSHDKKANVVKMGWKVHEYFTKIMSLSEYQAQDLEAVIKIDDNGEFKIIKIKGLEVVLDNEVPYIIDVEYDRVYDVINKKIKERKNNDLISKLFFTKEEVRKINRSTDYKVKEDMDKSLKDLKAWVEYDKYLKNIGEQEDNL